MLRVACCMRYTMLGAKDYLGRPLELKSPKSPALDDFANPSRRGESLAGGPDLRTVSRVVHLTPPLTPVSPIGGGDAFRPAAGYKPTQVREGVVGMHSETTREVSALDACSALSDGSLDEAVAAQPKPKAVGAARASSALLGAKAKPKRRLVVVTAKPEWNDNVKPPSTLLERGRKNQRDFDMVEVL
jgi:hypothetical protein